MKDEKRNETLIQAVLEVIPDLFFLLDEDGTIREYRAPKEDALYLPPEAFLNKCMYEVLPPGVGEIFRSNVALALQSGETQRFEYDLEMPQGLMHYKCRLHILPGSRQIMASVVDLTPAYRLAYRLNERIKERDCLAAIMALTEDTSSDLATVLQQVVGRIGQGWQYPEITMVRLEHADTCYQTPGFVETAWMQTEERVPANGERLRLTVAYTEARPLEDEGPFLADERQLLHSIILRLVAFFERRFAAQLVAEKDHLIATMFDQVTDSVLLSDPETFRFIQFNDAAHLGLGYTREEFSRLSVQDIQTELPMEQIAAITSKAKFGEEVSLETRHRHKNGSVRDTSLTLRNITGSGRPMISAVWRDITEQKAKERDLEKHRLHLEELIAERTAALAETLARLQNSEERFKYALDATTDGLWDWNLKTNRTYINAAYSIMLGYKPGDLKLDAKSHWIDLLHPDERDQVVAMAQEKLEKAGGYEIEFRMRAKNGDYKWILSRGKVVAWDEHGRPARAVGTHTDLTARKEMELALHVAKGALERSNQELETVFNTVTTGIVLIRDRIIVRCNRKLEELFGYEPDELIGRTTRCWYPDDATFAAVGAEVAEQIKNQGSHFRAEQLLVRKDGSCFWGRMKAQAIIDVKESGMLVGVIEDITLERESMDAILRAKELAEQANRTKSEFLANMSHEIRTPMNAIIGMSHLAINADPTPRLREYLTKIHASGKHLLGIVDGILDFSKIEAGKLTIDRVDFQLDQVLEKVADFFGEKIGSKGLELLFQIAPDVPRSLVGDPMRIGQILLNYTANAIKFTDTGEVCISVSVADRGSENALLRFEVRDTGIGIGVDQQQQLFQGFQQADMSITRKYGGTGLGLAISKRLAELMGGDVGVTSEFGVGSTFWFTVRTGVGAEQKPLVLPETELWGCPVLVVDDNEDARLILTEMLSAMKFSVATAASGIEAIERVGQAASQGRPYRFILLDWKMPEMDGIETSQRLKDLKLTVAPQIIMVTAYGRDDVLERLGDSSADLVLEKPVTPSRLFNTAMNVLYRNREGAGQRPARPAVLPARGFAGLSGVRVLLVEDNDINQEVIVEFLERVGCRVETADNGLEALTMVRTNDYDLVLMDMQMPIMDGITATVEIRKLPELAELPIIAMTANVMEEDRKACLAAGMNDFVAKPIEPDCLNEVLQRWALQKQAAADTKRPVVAAAPESLPDHIDGIDIRLGLSRTLNNPELYLSILRKFVARHKYKSDLIRQAMAVGDLKNADFIAHLVKGLAGTIGATELQISAGELEYALEHAGDKRSQDELLARFTDALNTVITALESSLPAGQKSAGETVDMEILEDVCHDLIAMLKDYNAKATDMFKEKRSMLRSAFPDYFQDIETAFGMFDFDAAKDLLEKALNTIRNMR